jgi:tRNA (guanine26-N2/guanine27-N2)-dimethyltransferase
LLLGKTNDAGRYVIANDLSDTATATMKRNVELNGLGPADGHNSDPVNENLGKVRVNEGDAW